jgi:hypothetical protein
MPGWMLTHSMRVTRREATAALLGAGMLRAQAATIRAIRPRSNDGVQFVVYADCCSGQPGTRAEMNFAAVNEIIRRLEPQPEFLIFPGDHISGSQDPEEHRRQFRYWLDHEMKWASDRHIPIYHTTSNHNTWTKDMETVYREVMAKDLPKNGPPGQEGLSYFVRRGQFLFVAINSYYSGLGPNHVEHEWLDKVLTQNADAKFKFVGGHQPVWPFNGYGTVGWVIDPSDSRPFWDVLVKHKVTAYLASHVLAFDVQVHSGVLQIATAGAGTQGGYPNGGFMPGRTEYLHAVQAAIDEDRLRYQVLDIAGTIREWLIWPIWDDVPRLGYSLLPEDKMADTLKAANQYSIRGPGDAWFCAFRFKGVVPPAQDHPQTLLCGSHAGETAAALRVMLDDSSLRLRVDIQTQSGYSADHWLGPRFKPGEPFEFELGLHSGMGPGGVMYRAASANGHGEWSSLETESSKGCEDMVWPPTWVTGHGHYSPNHDVWRGEKVILEWSGVRLLSRAELFT